jgi:hypothetical protein
METVKVPMHDSLARCPALERRLKIRAMSAHEFIELHASGTLRKNKRLGMVWRNQYLEERVAYEFGFGFECLPRSHVTFGDAFSEADSHPVTEAGWHIERHIELSIFPEDRFEAKYINVEYKDGSRREGIGMIVRETSADFVPDGHLVFAIVAEYEPLRKAWLPAKNPS